MRQIFELNDKMMTVMGTTKPADRLYQGVGETFLPIKRRIQVSVVYNYSCNLMDDLQKANLQKELLTPLFLRMDLQDWQ